MVALAIFTGTAAVNHYTYSHCLTNGELCYSTADCFYLPHDFMAWNHRVNGTSPLTPYCMDVTVTDATIKNFYMNIIRAKVPSLDVQRFNRRLAAGCSVSFNN
jgi:hypothetical protein